MLQFDTIYSADSVEFCPIIGFQSYFVVGTYQVQEGESTYSRLGKIYLFEEFEGGMKKIQSIDSDAILDMKWCLESKQPLLAAVSATGQTILYELNTLGILIEMARHQNTSQTLCLSVDWSPFEPHKLVVSQSNGNIQILIWDNLSLDLVDEWKGHGFEAWIACFDPQQSHIVYSGADDCTLKIWDLRSMVASTNKIHEAGVTTISRHPFETHLISTGSYDEHVRLWDVRFMKVPLSSISTGGGIWRIRWSPKEREKCLVASMYNGFHILKSSADFTSCEIIQEYKEHTSIAYGADWSRHSDRVATCSFYDHLLRLWTPKKELEPIDFK
jgi:diphthamide biosynthesis protein 7